MIAELLAAFRSQIGTEFVVPGTTSLRLEAVVAFEDAVTEGFSLQFAGPGSAPMPQGVFPLVHEVLGMREVFLVPVQDARGDRRTYEAIFNSLKLQADSAGGA